MIVKAVVILLAVLVDNKATSNLPTGITMMKMKNWQP